MPTKIQVRRGTATEWTVVNTVLASGEIGFETNTGKFKIGDGNTVWNSLSYHGDAISAGLSSEIQNRINADTTHFSRIDNPHSTTKSQVGLANVDNTADTNKPVSDAQATADGLRVLKAGDTMTGPLVLSGDPTANLHPASRQWTLAQITALINGAPGILDTLGEIATQLATDENAVSALTSAMATETSNRTTADTALQGRALAFSIALGA